MLPVAVPRLFMLTVAVLSQVTAYMGQGSSRPGGRPFEEEGAVASPSTPAGQSGPVRLFNSSSGCHMLH